MAYETRYGTYSQGQLHALFSTEQWNGLTLSERLDACQEVTNRYAAEYNVEPCLVTHQPMEGNAYGEQSGKSICLNTYLVRDGQFCATFTDQNGNTCERVTNALAPGWNILDTVYHEGTHGIQTELDTMPSTYLPPDSDWNLYRIQGVEKQAYAMGQSRTLQALSDYEKSTGKLDATRGEYLASVRNDAFQTALNDAAQHYNDPNIEQTLATVIQDRENNLFRSNASPSYQAIYQLCDTYNLYSAADLSQHAQALDTLAAGTEPTPSAHAQPSAEPVPLSLDSEESTSHLEDGLSLATPELSSLAFPGDDGLTSSVGSATVLTGADYDDGSNAFDLSASGESAGIATDDGMTSDDGMGTDDGIASDDGMGDAGDGGSDDSGGASNDSGLSNDD